MRIFELFEKDGGKDNYHPLITYDYGKDDQKSDELIDKIQKGANWQGHFLDNDLAPPDFYDLKDKNWGIKQDDPNLDYSDEHVQKDNKSDEHSEKSLSALPDQIAKNNKDSTPQTLHGEDLSDYLGKTLDKSIPLRDTSKDFDKNPYLRKVDPWAIKPRSQEQS